MAAATVTIALALLAACVCLSPVGALGAHPSASSTAADVSNGPAVASGGPAPPLPVVTGNITVGPPGDTPSESAIDVALGEIFVTAQPDELVAVSASSLQVLASIPLGSGVQPEGGVVDPQTASVFVSVYPDLVVVVSAVTLQVETEIVVGSDPGVPAFDPLSQTVFVPNFASNNVSAINATTLRVTGNLSIPFPGAITFDAALDLVVIAGVYGFSLEDYLAGFTPTLAYPAVWIQDTGAPPPISLVAAPSSGGLYATVPAGGGGEVAVEAFNGSTGARTAMIPLTATDTSFGYLFGGFGMVFNPSDDALFVADSGSDQLFVINTTSDSVLTRVVCQAAPYSLTYSDSTEEVYAVNSGSGTLTAVATATYETVESVTITAALFATAFDSSDDLLVVVGSDEVYEVSPVTREVVRSTSVGPAPEGVAYDAATDEIFVADGALDQVTALWAGNLSVVGTVPVGEVPYSIAFDPSLGTLFVVCAGSNSVEEISASSLRVVGTVSVGPFPLYAAIDTADSELFVTNYQGSNVSVVAISNLTVVGTIALPAGTAPSGIAYDASGGRVFVSQYGAGEGETALTTVSAASRTIANSTSLAGDPFGVAVASTEGQLLVTNLAGSNVTVLNLTSGEVLGAVNVGTTPTSISLSDSQIFGYVANYDSGNISILQYGLPHYAVNFSESGLAQGVTWSVEVGAERLSAPAGASIDFSLPNGTFEYSIESLAGWHQNTSPYTGRFTVNGSDLAWPTLIFTPLSSVVTFTESGLASGVPWSVTFDNQTEAGTGPITFAGVPNGTLPFSTGAPGYVADPATGYVVIHGGNSTQAIGFAPVAGFFRVALAESGLPPGVTWTVVVTNASGTNRTVSSPAAEMTMDLPNGTYSYRAEPVGPWYPISAPNGSFVVRGAAVALTIAYAYTYSVTISQTGIPNGTAWTLEVLASSSSTVDAVSATAEVAWFVNVTGPQTTIALPNGTYVVWVTSPGFASSANSLTVAGGATAVAVSADSTQGASTTSAWWVWVVVAAGVGIAAAIAAVAVLYRRRDRRS